MTFKILDSDILAIPENKGKHWIRPILLGSGWAAVEMWINGIDHHPDVFAEPWDQGFGRYSTKQEAVNEAKKWAKVDDIPLFPDGCKV